LKVILYIILCLSVLVSGSTFDLKFGGIKMEEGYDLINTSDGSFVAVGTTNSYGTELNDLDGYFIKIDSLGSLLWEKNLKGIFVDLFIKVRQTSDDGFIILGKNDFTISEPMSFCKPWLVKYDRTGKLKWENYYTETDIKYDVNDFMIADDGGFLIIGTCITNSGTKDIWLMKTDSRGVKEWEKIFDGGLNDEGSSIVNNFSGGYLIMGNSQRVIDSKLRNQVWAINVDQSGNIGQNGIISISSDAKKCTSICSNPDNSYTIIGSLNEGVQPPDPIFPPPDPPIVFFHGFYILKFYSNLSTEWIKYINWDEYDFLRISSICNSYDGGFVFLGTTLTSKTNLFLAKTNGYGDIVWIRDYCSLLGYTETGNVIQLSDNSLALCGTADLINNYPDVSCQICIIKTDSSGNVIYPPAITSFSNDLNNVSINWEAVSNAGSYIVFASDTPDSNFTAIDTTAVNSWSSAVADSLKKNFYYIKARTENLGK